MSTKSVAPSPAPEWLADILRDCPPLLTLAEASKLLHVSARSLRRMTLDGRLVSVRGAPASSNSPAKVTIPRAEIGRYLRENARP